MATDEPSAAQPQPKIIFTTEPRRHGENKVKTKLERTEAAEATEARGSKGKSPWREWQQPK
jgi:hypothetical protein